MSGLQDLVADASQSLSVGPAADSLVKEVLQLIFSRADGFKGFLESFDAAGLGAVVSSWIGNPDAPAMAPHGVIQTFGGPAIAAIAQKIGLDPGVATSALAFIVPKLVGLLTPGGAIPSAAPPLVASFLAAPATAAAATAATVAATTIPAAAAAPAPRPAHGHGAAGGAAAPKTGRGEDTAGINRIIFPAAAAVLAAGFIYHFLTTRNETPAPAPAPAVTAVPATPAPAPAPVASAPVPAAPATPAPAVAAATPAPAAPAAETRAAHFAFSHDGAGVAVSGVLPDESTRASILAALKSVFGGEILDGFSVDPHAAAAPWLAKVGDAFGFLKAPNLHAVFDGPKVAVGGAVPESELQTILAHLKELFGGSVAVAPLPQEELAAFDFGVLQGDLSGQNLTAALNKATINFETGSAVIDDGGKVILLRAATLIKKLPDGSLVSIDGFTDQTGDPGRNLALSQRRADAVRQFLIEAGVAADGLAAKGHGSAASTTSGASRTDRRIEFTISHR